MRRHPYRASLARGFFQGLGIAAGLAAAGLSAYTLSGTINSFASGDLISADSVNTNFTALKTGVEDVGTRVETLESTLQTVTGDATGVTVSGDLSMNAGTKINQNGTPVAGYLSDGTPFYRKRFSGTWPTSISVSVPHGLGSIYTDDKIVAYNGWAKFNGVTHAPGEVSGADIRWIRYILINDTNIILTNQGNSSGGYEYEVFIDYLL